MDFSGEAHSIEEKQVSQQLNIRLCESGGSGDWKVMTVIIVMTSRQRT